MSNLKAFEKKYGTDGISRKIRFLMDKSGLNVHELSTKIEIPQPTLHRLINGDTENPKVTLLCKIADFFNVDIEYFLNESMGLPDGHTLFAPLLDWSQVASYYNKTFAKDANTKSISVSYNTDNLIFALKQNIKSLSTIFPLDSILIIEVRKDIKDGDYVLYFPSPDSSPIIRECISEGEDLYLSSHVEGLKKINLNDSKVIGCVIQMLLNFN